MPSVLGMQRRTAKGFKRPASLPKLDGPALVPYAKCRDELRGVGEGQLTRLILDTNAWAEVMAPILDALDEETKGRRGPARLFTAHELEAVLLFQRVCGLRSYREARDRLAGDRPEARRLLGLAQAKQRHASAVVHLRDGIPSEATVSRHKARFGETTRLEAYSGLFDRLLDEHLQDPDMREEARILDLDGSHILTHYTCPKTRRGTLMNEASVTCPEGGFLPPNSDGKGGHGFNMVSLTTATGLPLAWQVRPINSSEKVVAESLLQGEFAQKVQPKLDQSKLGVLSADGAFHSQPIRKLASGLGLVTNIHLSSHADRQSSRDSAAERGRTKFAIDGYPNWKATGHRELVCDCGQGSVARVLKRRSEDGRAVTRVEGRCSNCGNITITAGLWRTAQNPKRFARVLTADRERADWTFGNPLTYNDPIASEFGTGRFGHQEGFHGALVSRFSFLKTKHWYRRKAQAELDATMTFCIMHAAAMEQRKRARLAPSAQARTG
jgi:hypothetical protein